MSTGLKATQTSATRLCSCFSTDQITSYSTTYFPWTTQHDTNQHFKMDYSNTTQTLGKLHITFLRFCYFFRPSLYYRTLTPVILYGEHSLQSRSWLCLTGGAILGGKFCQGGQTTSPIWGSFTRYVMPLTGREDTLICTILFHSYGRQCYEALEREGSQSVKLELRKE